MKFILVVHPQANGKAKSANKIILGGIKKKLDEAKGLWTAQLNELLWSYRSTLIKLPKKTIHNGMRH